MKTKFTLAHSKNNVTAITAYHKKINNIDFICLQDETVNSGMSLTNCFEKAADTAIKLFDIKSPENVIWYHVCEEDMDPVCKVEIRWDGSEYYSPMWKAISDKTELKDIDKHFLESHIYGVDDRGNLLINTDFLNDR